MRFYVRDPKLRTIHKASVTDRVVHHIVSSELEKIFEPAFIAHSYACRTSKGTHKGILDLQRMALKVSKNNTRMCWALKCDVKKFFASVNHQILLKILAKRIGDQDLLALLEKIITSHSPGMLLGNLTSQFFANIYLNELDQFIKHELKVKYYVRYADDFVFLSPDRRYLEDLIRPVEHFLHEELDVTLHPRKVIFQKFRSGIDFLGYIIFPRHILPRTKTKKRLVKKIKEKITEFKQGKISEERLNATIQSYLGYLSHADTYKFRKELENQIWFWLTE